jgi:NitT/TauT family transport system substrate-binding protein
MRTAFAIVMAVGLVACGGGKQSAKKTTAAKAKGKPGSGGKPDPKAGSGSGSGGQLSAAAAEVERADPLGPAVVREYSGDRKLPAVTGPASFRALGKPRVVRFAIDTWAGWAPLVFANQGGAAKKVWKDGKGGEFQVEISVIDDPVTLTDTVLGGVHAAWTSTDMLPVMVQRLAREPKAMPRIYQLVDWSNGGHAIVARDAIKSVGELRGKTIVVPQNTPAQYFLYDQLLAAGLQPSDVTLTFVRDQQKASQLFAADRKIAAIATWAPERENVLRASGNKVLASTATANKLISHVWFARADFARDNPEIVEGLVRGILVAAEELKSDDNRTAAGKQLDSLMKLAPGTGGAMLTEAHWANYPDNRAFLLDHADPTGFERSYGNAAALFRGLRVVDFVPDFDQIADFAVIKKLGKDAAFGAQRTSYEVHGSPPLALGVEDGMVTKTMRVLFAPGSADLATGYDPGADAALEEIARVAAQTPNARIVISGHTDGSNKGRADEAAAKELATTRANAVREILAGKYALDPSQMVVAGYGWEKPADPTDADNHARNRRVELKVVRGTP